MNPSRFSSWMGCLQVRRASLYEGGESDAELVLHINATITTAEEDDELPTRSDHLCVFQEKNDRSAIPRRTLHFAQLAEESFLFVVGEVEADNASSRVVKHVLDRKSVV